MPTLEKFWMLAQSNQETTHYYCGYYEKCKPVFNMAIADALHIADFKSVESIYDNFNTIFPCEIWLVENNKVSKVL